MIQSRTFSGWQTRGETAFVAAILFALAWLSTTLIFHRLLLQEFGLSADAGYYKGHRDVMTVYLLPYITCVPPLVSSALFAIENLWRRQFVLPARAAYGALTLALTYWCWWSLRTNLDTTQRLYDLGAPADTIQAAAYASTLFPLATAFACALLAMLRRPTVVEAD